MNDPWLEPLGDVLSRESLFVSTPKLWCCLGDLEKKPEHFEKAWELSKHRFASAQRSLGRYYFDKKELAKSVDAFQLALDINPLHSGIWFTMGCAQMQLERWEDATKTFSRCLSVDDDNSQTWANLAAVHSARNKLTEARTCMVEATRRARENWKMWESFLGICMRLRDIQGIIQCMRRLVDLHQAARIQERVLGMLTAVVVNDVGDLYDFRTGSAFAGQLNELFRSLTTNNTSEPCYWRFYSELQYGRGDMAGSFDSRFKQMRAAKAKLWEERDPDIFTKQLEDLRDCFDAVEEALNGDEIKTETKQQHLQPFAYSVRDTVQSLQARLDAGVNQQYAWVDIHAAIAALLTRIEETLAKSSA